MPLYEMQITVRVWANHQQHAYSKIENLLKRDVEYVDAEVMRTIEEPPDADAPKEAGYGHGV